MGLEKLAANFEMAPSSSGFDDADLSHLFDDLTVEDVSSMSTKKLPRF
jgi:hypothetical protein